MSKKLFPIFGSFVIFLIVLYVVVWIQGLQAADRVLNLNRDVALGIFGSIAASCVFYFIFEGAIYISDSSGREELNHLRRFEDQYGISDALLNKSGENAIAIYHAAIKNAERRVWAMGISNNQFIDQHWSNIKARKSQFPALDVRVLFFDPEVTISRDGLEEGTPLINLFDFPEAIYANDKRVTTGRKKSHEIAGDLICPFVYWVTLPSYFSMMIVDDQVFFFPFLAIVEDAASNPIFVLDAKKKLGGRLVKHFEKLTDNELLCRKVDPLTVA